MARLPKVRPDLPTEPWTKEEAIAVMCRSLANLLEHWGNGGDADAVRYAENVLLRPELREVTALMDENERLKKRIAELEAQPAAPADKEASA